MFRVGLLFLSVFVTSTLASPPLMQGFIVNGQDTTIEEIPFQIALHYWNGPWCGGSIVNENTIISAAHCFDVFDFNNFRNVFTVRVGSTTLNSGGTIFGIDNVIIHPEFNDSTYDFDVAIIKLNDSLTFQSGIQRINMAEANFRVPANTSAQVSGWGLLSHQGAFPTVLQKIIMPIIDDGICSEIYRNINPITERMFCAGFFYGEGDSCNGDSGGPLVVDNILYGIVSWGMACAEVGFPGVYALVSNLRPWIDQNMA